MRIDKGTVRAAFAAQPLHINLCDDQLGIEPETVGLFQERSVLEDQCIAAIDYILRAFAEATAAVDVSADGTRTLLGKERLQIGVFANELVAGRKVEDNLCTCQGKMVAWRCRCPYVLADFDGELGTLCRTENLHIRRDGDMMAGKMNTLWSQIL